LKPHGWPAEFDYWSAAEDQLLRDVTIGEILCSPVNFIVHSRQT
jgi:hypothetical protein